MAVGELLVEGVYLFYQDTIKDPFAIILFPNTFFLPIILG